MLHTFKVKSVDDFYSLVKVGKRNIGRIVNKHHSYMLGYADKDTKQIILPPVFHSVSKFKNGFGEIMYGNSVFKVDEDGLLYQPRKYRIEVGTNWELTNYYRQHVPITEEAEHPDDDVLTIDEDDYEPIRDFSNNLCFLPDGLN